MTRRSVRVNSIPALTQLLTTRAREALMMAGAGGAMRATGGARQPSGFNNCGEGGRIYAYCSPLARARAVR